MGNIFLSVVIKCKYLNLYTIFFGGKFFLLFLIIYIHPKIHLKITLKIDEISRNL